MLFRRFVSFLFGDSKYFKQLLKRALFLEVAGHSPNKDLKALNPFERWLFILDIEQAKRLDRDVFRHSCIEAIGEDPFEGSPWEKPSQDDPNIPS